MKGTARQLRVTIEAARPRLLSISDDEASARIRPDHWSNKEILGHLIDSASNNHQRFVRAQQTNPLTFPRYEQNHWVSAQGYASASWPALIELWYYYNLHLAHVMEPIRSRNVAHGPDQSCPHGPSGHRHSQVGEDGH